MTSPSTEPGRRIGPYVFLGRLGAGGMGEVHLARDVRLGREVALKLLAPALTRDADHLARFRREALALASLNHPNIASLHGFEEIEGGTIALVLERVEGESLAQRLARGPMPLEEALQVCAQVAQALEAAHERGVIHRDMKPGNVMIGARGLVKVLDFGLAKRTDGLPGIARPAPPEAGAAPAPLVIPEAPSGRFAPPPSPPPVADDAHTILVGPAAASEDAPTIAPPGGSAAGVPGGGSPLTELGTTVGTPGYMSPEQVVAGEQDERTDVFAFGCVLYECLTGRRAFTGADRYQAMAAVLTDEPDFSALPARTPGRIRALLERCLQKQKERRLADIHSARIELEEALGIRRAAALREGESYAVPNHLPVQPTSFVGREHVLHECARLLERTRLLTLTGMGGSGKTRLAVRLAESQLDQHPDGAWFVDLAPLTEDSRVAEAAAAALGAREESGRSPLQSLIEQVGPKRMLLVIDNCEHLLAGAAALTRELLARCPEVRLVATSREPLGAAGETVFAVPTLALPAGASLSELAASEAVRLFAERAAAAARDFDLAGADVPVVAEICRRLDGIPLAIELAAARVKVLGIGQIRARLDDRFRLLTTGGRGAVPRQQTLHATIQWSWDQCAPAEQALLRHLSVFVDGWTLERATAVVEEHADEFHVLDLLTRLVEKSLVVVERTGSREPRYRFLESVWRFALERLDAGGDSLALRHRHLAIYLALAERAEAGLTGPEQGAWFADLHRERGNLDAALAYCGQAPGGGVIAMRLASSLSRYWSTMGQFELGRRALFAALELGGHEPTALRAKALVRASGFALNQNDIGVAKPLIEESLAICRALGDRKGIARALGGLGVVVMQESDIEAGERAAQESLETYRELGERRGVALSLHNLGYVAWVRREYETARRIFEEALEHLETLGDEESIALTLSNLAPVMLYLPRPDPAAARAQLASALERVRRLGIRRSGLYVLEAAADFAVFENRFEQAAELIGAATALRELLGTPAFPLDRKERDRLTARVRERLGERALASRLAAGHGLSFEQGLDIVQAVLGGPAPGPAS
jgi:non-specific serine/threonine protein kinase